MSNTKTSPWQVIPYNVNQQANWPTGIEGSLGFCFDDELKNKTHIAIYAGQSLKQIFTDINSIFNGGNISSNLSNSTYYMHVFIVLNRLDDETLKILHVDAPGIRVENIKTNDKDYEKVDFVKPLEKNKQTFLLNTAQQVAKQMPKINYDISGAVASTLAIDNKKDLALCECGQSEKPKMAAFPSKLFCSSFGAMIVEAARMPFQTDALTLQPYQLYDALTNKQDGKKMECQEEVNIHFSNKITHISDKSYESTKNVSKAVFKNSLTSLVIFSFK